MTLTSARRVRLVAALAVLLVITTSPARSQSGADLPVLTRPVNDFADVIDPAVESEIERVARALDRTTGDAVVVATVRTIEPYGDINEFAVKLFENHGRGIGRRGKDNGVLFVLAVDNRQMRIETGYDLEQFITDGFAGETLREHVAPHLRRGDFSSGIRAGVMRLVQRIARGRNVTLEDEGTPLVERDRGVETTNGGLPILIVILILIIVIGNIHSNQRRLRRRGRRWGGRGWSGWNSGVGPFGSGGGFGGGFGGFGGRGGGGFGGFGGGRSGGGGASAGW